MTLVQSLERVNYNPVVYVRIYTVYIICRNMYIYVHILYTY